jgi:hypothetical protein
MVGAGKAAFMSVTEVMVVAEVDMLMLFFGLLVFSTILLALSETTEKDDAK